MSIEACERPDIPRPLPRLMPIADDLLAIIAIQVVEIDALRIQTGQVPIGQRREFTTEQLRNGRKLGPTARFATPDKLVVRLES